ncbi:MAG: hypothetical protein AVDCRST_MAG60-2297 [uncultured Nocardioides sp.]|uniref:Uncharacterized protein n=1 Tax=uncultured Nocardioides sp. TaxID=198441 RepID=A0A6J4P523_9ACTN|nr:MAG: hypothetical protein AVDCRST_MAG60-2297 [uncultured Nocardioides sp.]
MGELEGRNPAGDPSRMRISDADRHKVAELLRHAAGEGRLDLDELDERLEHTFAAKTYADLVPITADLHPVAPVTGSLQPGQAAGRPGVLAGHASSTAIMGDCKRRGVWQVPESHAAFALMGSVLIDLRQATLTSHDTTINASAIMGDVKVVVPAHFNVIVDGTPIMGDYGQGRDRVPAQIGPDSPTIHVRGIALMGSVSVTRMPPPGTPRKIIGTY